ncbi:MAG: hypothetical protein NTU83_08430 [Candidatus Hydrogenedentes bacterium]|nr:hypothetical protein [Candidatus Hydrogenedentota bacterium]
MIDGQEYVLAGQVRRDNGRTVMRNVVITQLDGDDAGLSRKERVQVRLAEKSQAHQYFE